MRELFAARAAGIIQGAESSIPVFFLAVRATHADRIMLLKKSLTFGAEQDGHRSFFTATANPF